MILPIVKYGAPILRKPCAPVHPAAPGLEDLIANMWQTMHHANGCGLAAPQVNVPVSLFIVEDAGVFINAKIISVAEEFSIDEEGCLSIPGLSEEVSRPEWIKIRYMDEHFQQQVKEFSGSVARAVQHEYDHVHGKLYLDHLTPLQRKLLYNKLERIRKGKVKAGYPMV